MPLPAYGILPKVLIDVYRIKEVIYVHPLKVWDRYSPQMFLPHIVTGKTLWPVFQSGEAAEVSSVARKNSHSEKTSIAPWDSVYKKIFQYKDSGEKSATVATELQALKQELARMLIGSHAEFNKLSEAFFTLGDLLGIRDRMIGSGRIGGKAAGMLLARRILLDLPGEIEQDFLAGSFPPDIYEQFRSMLDYFGQAPIIIRSSSLLEDSFGNAFAGKYLSIFCANQGGPEERLNAFSRAVKLVYASALSPEVLSYRLRRGLGESDEQMAILVQRVSGMRYRHYFFPNLPNSQLLFSFMKDGYLFDPPYLDMETGSAGKPVLTFNRLISRTPFVKVMGEMVGKLERAYGHPVDTEFTAFVNSRGSLNVNLLQCRPLRLPGLSGPLKFPEHIQSHQILFKSMKVINGGLISQIKYIIYIDPRRYAVISSVSLKRSVGRIVGAQNKHPLLVDGQFLMMGPGRWGSSNIDLGVNVSYADIDNTAVLVEIAREASGHVPEVSYGTHFFQDLVEGQIIYLPVYPELLETAFNNSFFEDSPNSLEELLPGNEQLKSVVHVINIPAVTNGKYAKVVADPQTQKAVCFLE
ncbi:MAG: PEP/pyruvate-binding domain-containing protein [Bacillota bacterium]|nr:PEP/pyruvate-binding domain-containing protein [Bacillota bacterium]